MSPSGFQKTFLLGLGLLVLSGCNRAAKLTVTGTAPTLRQWEEEAAPEPVHVFFNGSAAALKDVGQPLSAGVSMSPAMPGEWKWVNDKDLLFTPRKEWPVGTAFEVKFDKSLFPDHVQLKEYTYSFKTPDFSASIQNSEFFLDPTHPKLKKIIATVSFTHPVDTAEFEKRVRLYQGTGGGWFGGGKDPQLASVRYNKSKTEAYVHSETLPVPPKDSELTIEIEKGFGSSLGGSPFVGNLKARVVVPGVFSVFQVKKAGLTLVRNEKYEPEQVLLLETTNGVLESEFQKNLTVYLLPKDLPSFQGRPAQRNYRWSDPALIGPEVLNAAQKLSPVPIPTEREFSTLHSFRYNAEVGRFLFVKINKGTPSYGDYVLSKEFDIVLRVPEFPRELNIMHDGALLSLSGEKKLSILSRGNEALRFEVSRILPGQVNHLVSQSRGRFKSPEFQNWNFNYKNITEKYTEERMLELVGPGKTQHASFDFASYLSEPGREGTGLFFFKVQAWDPVNKRPVAGDLRYEESEGDCEDTEEGCGDGDVASVVPHRSGEDGRLILVTDMGLLVKDSKDGTHDVFVQSVHSGLPMAGVNVSLVGLNGLPIFTRTTDGDGRVSFPNMAGYTDEKTPTVYIARRGGDMSFIPYEGGDRRLELSRFDVGGAETLTSGENLSVFLFSDRGIYRPGETIQMAMIVKPSDWRQDLTGVPLEVVFQDSRGTEVQKKRIKLSAAAFEEISYPTEETSATGVYEASVYTVKDGERWSRLGSAAVRVEEFLPDRLRIVTRLSAEREAGWVSPEGLKGSVTLHNLFGTPAEGRRVTGAITLRPSFPVFKAYSDYTFFDPLQAKKQFTETLKEQITNGEGEATFPLPLDRFEKATYRLVFSAEGFEVEGGRGVSSEASALVSPLPYLIGHKADGPLGYVHKGAERHLSFIALNPELRKTSVKNLRLQILEQKYISALMQQKDGTYRYQSVLRENSVSSREISVPAEGWDFVLPTTTPGDFALVLKDGEDTELARVRYTVAGEANLVRNLDRNAELQVTLDKTDYNPGEDIELQISAPYTGAGLITVERDKLYAHKWFKTDGTNSVHRIRVPEQLEGNAYVNVTFLRNMSSPEIFMSPLSHGVAPFSISRRSRTNLLTLTSPELAKPGEPFVIKYKGERPGKIVIYAVDEGILQVAGYRLPDPLTFFFRKRALEVQTFQILDLLLPEYKMIQTLSAPGGDEGLEAIGKNLNPFKRKRDKAVVFWSGIQDVDGNERQVVYKVPDHFAGTLRVMAVAVSNDVLGTAEKTALIRGPFVLTPNVPPFLAPGDEAEISVGVANNVSGSGKNSAVKIRLGVADGLEIRGESERVVNVPEGKEGSAVFHVKAGKKPGAAVLTFTAALGGEHLSRTVETSVRPSSPFVTTIKGGYVKSGKEDIPVGRKLYPHHRTQTVSASPLPFSLAQGLMTYLDNYPYLETRALVARAFSMLSLSRIGESGVSRAKAGEKIAEAERLLQARQNSEGAFGFWAANAHADPLDSVFVVHFLGEAKERGFPISEPVLNMGLGYLRNVAGSLPDSLEAARVKAYAVYVLTRNGIVTTNYLNSLRAHLENRFPHQWEKDVTAVCLAGAYQIMKQGGPARYVLSGVRLGKTEGLSPNDQRWKDAMALYVTSEHFTDTPGFLREGDLLSLAQSYWENGQTPLSSALAILALSSYAESLGPLTPAEVEFQAVSSAGKSLPLTAEGKTFPKASLGGDVEKVTVRHRLDQGLFYQVTQAGFDLESPSQEEHRGVEVHREIWRDGKPVRDVALGEEVEVHIKGRTLPGVGRQPVVVVDLLPGGFELVEDSIQPAEKVFYVDAREDRVVVYAFFSEDMSSFVYRVKAINKGAYTLPAVFSESTQDRSIQSHGAAGSVVVQ